MSWAGWVVVGYVALVSVPLSVFDVREHRLPNKLVVPGIALAGLCALTELVLSGGRHWMPLACGAAYFVFLLVLCASGGLGMGDVKLAAVLGVASGFVSWQCCAASVFVAFILGGVAACVLWLLRRRGRIPFGPFMLAGFWLAMTIALVQLES